jgi:nucleotidyltransferase/DNA polymerase involved in DNA repair
LHKKGLLARTVTIKVRYANFTTVTRSHTEEPATHDAARIMERALALLERTDAARRPVRLLGVGAHGLLDRDELLPSSQLLPLESLS